MKVITLPFAYSYYILYSDQIYHSKNLFGCVGLKRKEYCILNKQYTKEEYEELVPKIIEHMKKTGEWGQFFPAQHSPFGYNESLSSEYFPLKEQDVKSNGWNWHNDNPSAVYQGAEPEIPDHIDQVEDHLTNSILRCETSGKLYKIMPQELRFYRQIGIPIPRRAPQQRHNDRIKLRPERKLYDRKCTECKSDLKSPYSKERVEKVYCEQCYLKEVY